MQQPKVTEISRDDCYEPVPLVSTELVFGCGLFLFVVAMIWPPLILVVTFLAWKVISYCFRTNDEATSRRMLLEEFSKTDKDSASLREIPSDVTVTEGYWTNARGMLLHTTTLLPKDQPVKAILCHCHGYLENGPFNKRRLFATLAQKGIAVFMVSYEGHGRSDGHLGLVTDFDVVIDDIATYYTTKCKEEFPDRKAFLIGESMGGAVAYGVHQKVPNAFAGVVFVSPMCKISDDMLPPNWVIECVRAVVGPQGTTTVLGYLPIGPSKGDLKQLSFKLPERKALFTRAPSIFGRNPRLATGRELLNMTKRISESLGEFDAPFLVQHGKSDRVTDPQLSQALYDDSKSSDKTIKLYDGMWHSMLNGEPEENMEIVLNDIVAWVLERAEDKGKKDK